MAIAVVVSLVFTRREKEESRKPRKVIRIHERIIERPVHMSKERKEEPVPEVKKEEPKSEVKQEEPKKEEEK